MGLANTLTVVVPEPPDAETAGAAGETLLEISRDGEDSDPIVFVRQSSSKAPAFLRLITCEQVDVVAVVASQ